MAVRGPLQDTLAGDIVTILVSPDGPYGVLFIPDSDGCGAVIKSFERLPSGKFGPIQRDGGVHPGDALFEINDVEIVNTKFEEVQKLIANRNVLRKEFKFINSKDYYRRKRGMSYRANPTDQKDTFLSTIKRTRLAGAGSTQFVEYEISCQLRVIGDKIQKEIVYQWSVWHRYSQFHRLHKALKSELAWQIENIEFPSPKTFAMNKLGPEFIEKRRDELKEYWQKITSLEKVTDFMKHHCSPVLKEFLDVESNLNKNIVSAPDLIESESKDGSSEEQKSTAAPILGRRQSLRTMSKRSTNFGTKAQSDNSPSSAHTNSSSKGEGLVKESSSPLVQAVAPNTNPSPPPPPATSRPAPPPPTSGTQPPPPPPPLTNKAAVRPPPPPPSAVPAPPTKPAIAAPIPPPQPSPAPATSSTLPKPQGARINLLSSINALRKD